MPFESSGSFIPFLPREALASYPNLIHKVEAVYGSDTANAFLDLRLDSEERRYVYSEYWLKAFTEAIDNEDFMCMIASLAMLGAGIASLVTDSYQMHATDFTLEDHLSDPEKRFCILLYGQGTSGERIFFHLKPDWASSTAYCLSFPSDGNRGALFRAAFARLFEYRVTPFPPSSQYPSLIVPFEDLRKTRT